MPYGGHKGQWCKICGGHVAEVGPLSARYRCRTCARSRMLDNHDQLKVNDGPYFTHWRSRLLAAFGVTVDSE